MKSTKKKSIYSIIGVLLDIWFFGGIFATIFIAIYTLLIRKDAQNGKEIIVYALFMISGILMICIVYELRKIFQTVKKDTPFIMGNVKSFNRMGVYCFLISAIYVIGYFIKKGFNNFSILQLDSKGIHTDAEFIIFFFAGVFSLVMAELFNKAIEIKDENELTI